MELFNPLQTLEEEISKGEYRETEESRTSPYDLDQVDYTESEYQHDKYQNQNNNQKWERNHQKNLRKNIRGAMT